MDEIIKNVAELPYNWEKLNNKTLLISGGTGFIGSFICDVIRYRNNHYGCNTKIISLSRTGGIDDATVSHIKSDVANKISLDSHFDYVLHLASHTHPKQYAENPIGTIITNIYGCNNLLELAKEHNARFLFTSSVEIYGECTNRPIAEEYSGYINCNNARSGYNEAKRVCESLIQSYRNQYDLDAVIVRLSRVFGPDKKNDTKAIAQFMHNAVTKKDIVLKSSGMQRFSYCYIADAVSGIFKILFDGINGEAYNLSDDDEGLTLGEYANYIASFSNKQVIFQIEYNDSVSKSTYALLNCDKLKKLGWKPIYSVSDGLKDTYKILTNRHIH